MRTSVTVVFDFEDLKKKLTRYFSDSAPIETAIEISTLGVAVTDVFSGREVFVGFKDLSVKDQIREIISECERSLYPKIVEKATRQKELTLEERKELLLRGTPLENIQSVTETYVKEVYTLCRISNSSMTVILRDSANRPHKAAFHKPLFIVLRELEKLSPEERFAYLKENAEVEKQDA